MASSFFDPIRCHFKEKHLIPEETMKEQCAICCEGLSDKIVKLCNGSQNIPHYLHIDCVKRFFASPAKKECPTCRSTVLNEVKVLHNYSVLKVNYPLVGSDEQQIFLLDSVEKDKKIYHNFVSVNYEYRLLAKIILVSVNYLHWGTYYISQAISKSFSFLSVIAKLASVVAYVFVMMSIPYSYSVVGWLMLAGCLPNVNIPGRIGDVATKVFERLSIWTRMPMPNPIS